MGGVVMPTGDPAPTFGGWLKSQALRKPKGRFGRFLMKWTADPAFMEKAGEFNDGHAGHGLDQLERYIQRRAWQDRRIERADRELVEDLRGLGESWMRYRDYVGEGRIAGRYA